MSDIKIGDKVIGLKGNNRVAGTVVNLREGHAYIKAPVCGVYSPVITILPLNKVTKLNEGKMKAHAVEKEKEEKGSNDDYEATLDQAVKQAKGIAFDKRYVSGNMTAAHNAISKLGKKHGIHGLERHPEVKSALARANMEEEVEQIDEVGPQKRLKRVFNKLRDARAGAAYKQSGMPVPEREPGHKNTVDHNKALGRALRRMGEETDKSGLSPEQIAKRKAMDAADFKKRREEMNAKRQAGTAPLRTTYREEVEQVDEAGFVAPAIPKVVTKKHLDRALRDARAWSHEEPKPASNGHLHRPNYEKAGDHYDNLLKKADKSVVKAHNKQFKEEVEQVEEGYKARRAFGTAYDKMHDPFQDSKRRFKSRELEHELAHETPSPRHHDQTPHDVHIDGKKWKTFGSAAHAHNVANKLSISGKRATVHKTPIAEKAPPGWEGTVKAMKKHPEIDNPFALAWWMKRKGAKSHKGKK